MAPCDIQSNFCLIHKYMNYSCCYGMCYETQRWHQKMLSKKLGFFCQPLTCWPQPVTIICCKKLSVNAYNSPCYPQCFVSNYTTCTLLVIWWCQTALVEYEWESKFKNLYLVSSNFDYFNYYFLLHKDDLSHPSLNILQLFAKTPVFFFFSFCIINIIHHKQHPFFKGNTYVKLTLWVSLTQFHSTEYFFYHIFLNSSLFLEALYFKYSQGFWVIFTGLWLTVLTTGWNNDTKGKNFTTWNSADTEGTNPTFQWCYRGTINRSVSLLPLTISCCSQVNSDSFWTNAGEREKYYTKIYGRLDLYLEF